VQPPAQDVDTPIHVDADDLHAVVAKVLAVAGV
jgi:hypothetical protein